MKGGENHEPPRSCIEVLMYPEEDGSWLSFSYTMVLPYSAAVATVDLHCKTVCFNKLFGDVNTVVPPLQVASLHCGT